MTMKVWITRDDDGCCIWNDREKPKKNDWDCYEAFGKYSERLTEDQPKFIIKEFFGFTPRKGSCKQYELTLKEIK